jgi:hypothetical protein
MNCNHEYIESGTCEWTSLEPETLNEVTKIYNVKECLHCKHVIEERTR